MGIPTAVGNRISVTFWQVLAVPLPRGPEVVVVMNSERPAPHCPAMCSTAINLMKPSLLLTAALLLNGGAAVALVAGAAQLAKQTRFTKEESK